MHTDVHQLFHSQRWLVVANGGGGCTALEMPDAFAKRLAKTNEVAQLRTEASQLRAAIAEARRDQQCADVDTACPPEPPAIPVLGVASIFHASFLMRCFRSIDFAVKTLVLVHNGRDPGVASAVSTLKREQPALRVVHEPDNVGCPGAWNRIIAADPNAPWWLIVNDEIQFPRGALRNIASRVWSRQDSQPDAAHFKFWYQTGKTGWSCFALTARAVREVGSFDENLYPVYYEDEDYDIRLRLAGLSSVHLRDVLVVHGASDDADDESGSMRALDNRTGDAAMRAAFSAHLVRGANREYMLAKWGRQVDDDAPRAHDRQFRPRALSAPFGRASLPPSWWRLDVARRRCIVNDAPSMGTRDPIGGWSNADLNSQYNACPYDASLAAQAAQDASKEEL